MGDCARARLRKWPKFIKHIQDIARANSPVSKFELAADAIVTGDLPALISLLRENPKLAPGAFDLRSRSASDSLRSGQWVEDFRQKTPKNIVE